MPDMNHLAYQLVVWICFSLATSPIFPLSRTLLFIIALAARLPKTAKTSQSDVLCNLGLALWQQMTHDALLTQQMRVTDARYQELLACLRLGRCNLDDYVLLSTRILNNNINDTIMNGTPVNVLGNKLRLDINCLLVNHHSETLGEVVLTVRALDA